MDFWFIVNPVYFKHYQKVTGNQIHSAKCSFCNKTLRPGKDARVYADASYRKFACSYCARKQNLKPRVYYDGGKAWMEYLLRSNGRLVRKIKRVPHLDVQGAVNE